MFVRAWCAQKYRILYEARIDELSNWSQLCKQAFCPASQPREELGNKRGKQQGLLALLGLLGASRRPVLDFVVRMQGPFWRGEKARSIMDACQAAIKRSHYPGSVLEGIVIRPERWLPLRASIDME
jgi:hypothetical protein